MIAELKQKLSRIRMSLARGVEPNTCTSTYSKNHMSVTMGFPKMPNIYNISTMKCTIYAMANEPCNYTRSPVSAAENSAMHTQPAIRTE